MKTKAIMITIITLIFLAGCAFAPLSSRVGMKTADQYQEAYDIGTPSADKIKDSWPYVSGLIKASFGEDYKLKLSVSLQNTVETLDVLCLKKKLTDEEKGQIIGAVNRLEFLAGKEFWDKYGSVILGRIKALAL
jgi:hypothetical protein